MLDPHLALIKTLMEEVAQLKSLVERMGRPGTITDVDYSNAAKPRVRLQIGKDSQGQPVKSPWVPASTRAGARNQHDPLSVGQQVMLFSPDGCFEQGLVLPYGHSQKIQSPSTDPSTWVDGSGQTDIRFKDGKHQVKAGDNTAHLITTNGQRIQVEDITKLVFKIGQQAFMLNMDALVPTNDIGDF